MGETHIRNDVEMRIGAVTLAYNDEKIIGGTIKCLSDFVDRHVVLISERPYFGKYSPPDRTEEIAIGLGANVIKGTWSLDNFQRSLGNSLMDDVDWVLTFDSDEMMTKDDLKKFISYLQDVDAPAVIARPEVYWYSTDYRLRPIPDYAPVIATNRM